MTIILMLWNFSFRIGYYRVRTAQGKPGKPGKRDLFEKNQGKPGKLREFSYHFYNLRENSGNFIVSNISSFIPRFTNRYT